MEFDLKKLLADFKSLNIAAMREPGFLARMQSQQIKKLEQVASGSGRKSLAHCPACEAKQNEFVFEAFGVPIVRCLNCDLRYLTSQPVNLNEVYGGSSYLTQAKTNYLSNVDYRTERFSTERIELIRQFMPFERGQKILDVGCGTGWFLDYARKKDYQVYGQEFADQLGQWTEENRKLKVFRGPLSDIPEKFQVITLFDVLEHVPSPRALMKEVSHLLTPGGIAVIFTPNFESIGISLMKEKSNLIMPCDHLTYFTLKSAKSLAEQFQLQVLMNETRGIDIGDLKGLFDLTGPETSVELWQQMSDHIQPIIDQAGLGNHLRMVVRK